MWAQAGAWDLAPLSIVGGRVRQDLKPSLPSGLRVRNENLKAADDST
jgi:hypothetical protein